MRELLRRGHEVALFYACNVEASESQLAQEGLAGLKLYRAEILNTRAQVLLSVWKPHMTRRFARLLDTFAPDAIIFHHLVRLSMDLPAAGARRGIPMIYYLHDYYAICPSYSLLGADGGICSGPSSLKCCRCLYEARYDRRRSFRRLPAIAGLPFALSRNRLRDDLVRHIDLFISPSSSLPAEFASRNLPLARCMILPYPGDNGITQPWDTRVPKRVRFGFLGNTKKKKGLDLLVKAFRGPLSGSLVIRGFPNQGALEGFRRSAPDFGATLQVFSRDRESFYNNVDVVVVPSVWLENQPVVIVDAFTFGKPVICSNLGGMTEMVEQNRSGLLFRAGDPDDLRRKALQLAENPSEVGRMRRSIPVWPGVEEHVDKLLEAVESMRL